MLEWLTANIGTILITIGLIVIVALIIRSSGIRKQAYPPAAQNAAAAEPVPWPENATAAPAAAAAPSGMLKT